MGQSCVEFVTEKELNDMVHHTYQEFGLSVVTAAYGMGALGLDKAVGLANNCVGRIGEVVAANVASRVLGIKECGFEQGKHGFDSLGKVTIGGKERFVVVESKFTTLPGPQALDRRTGEMSMRWVAARAGNMTNSNYKICTPANEALGKQLLAELSSQNLAIERVIVHVNPETLVTTVYRAEGMTDNWRQVDQYTSDQLTERLG